MPASKQCTSGALAGMLLVFACGDDSRPAPIAMAPDAGSDAQGQGLGAGVLGRACTSASDCGNGGNCATVQTFGMLSTLLSLLGVRSLPAPGGYCTRPCANDADCGSEGACLGALGSFLLGECRKMCSADDDCRHDGYECAKQGQADADAGAQAAATLLRLPNQCQAKPTPDLLMDDQVGAICGNNDDGVASCGHGYCTPSGCSGICTEDRTCGKGGVCVQNGFYGSAGVCAQTCTVDTDCRSYKATGAVGCVVAADGRRLCTLKQYPLDPNVVGAACTVATASSPATGCGAHGECSASVGGSEAPGGYCTLSGCPDDSVCGGGACIAVGLSSHCYARCTGDASCRPGYSCVGIPNFSGTSAADVCVPTPVAPDAGSAAPSEPSDASVLQTMDAASADAATADAG